MNWTQEAAKPFEEFWNKYVKGVHRWEWVMAYEIRSPEVSDKNRKIPHNYIVELPQIVEKIRDANKLPDKPSL